MKRALKMFLITAWVGFGVFLALYSAMGFFDFLWRGSVLFEVVVVVWFLPVAAYALRLTWRVWRRSRKWWLS